MWTGGAEGAGVSGSASGTGEEPELYGSYIQERQAYCRAAIALCEEQLAGWTEDSCAWDYQTVSPRNRIEGLKLSLYRLTRFQEDGMDDCLPLDVAFSRISRSSPP